MRVEQDKLKQQVIPPSDMLNDVERTVMDSVAALPSPASFRSKNRQRVISGIAATAVAMILLFFSQGPETEISANRDFTESRIIQSNLTSIWLTPVRATNGN